MEPGKVFVGGIAWDTTEESLREYFRTFGEVVEAMIMRDRITGRTRGFGFVVFADASIAEKVVRERHVIDGRTVEAKKAVPRDDNQNFSRNGSIHGSPGPNVVGSPGPSNTKKIFVGGLASTVTETEFKKYFDQFGTITDVVVMYDQNTQRPRGFGFITYDSEKAVDKVLLKTFHELDGKMVEVKRAVPKESAPLGQTRGYNQGLNGVSGSLNSHSSGYNLNSAGGRGLRMNGQLSPLTVSRSRYYPSSPSYLNGMNGHSGFRSHNGVSLLDYGHTMGTYYGGNSIMYDSGIAYDMKHREHNLSLNIANQNRWENMNLVEKTNSVNSNTYVNLGNGKAGVIGRFGKMGSSPIAKVGLNGSLRSGIPTFENNLGRAAGDGGIGGMVGMTSSHTADGGFGSHYGGDSFFLENAWLRPSSQVLGGSASFQYGLGSASVSKPNSSFGFSEGYNNVAARSHEGLAT